MTVGDAHQKTHLEALTKCVALPIQATPPRGPIDSLVVDAVHSRLDVRALHWSIPRAQQPQVVLCEDSFPTSILLQCSPHEICCKKGQRERFHNLDYALLLAIPDCAPEHRRFADHSRYHLAPKPSLCLTFDLSNLLQIQ